MNHEVSIKTTTSQKVFIVDDDDAVRDSLSMFLESEEIPHIACASATEFLDIYDSDQKGCLVVDIRMPGTSGLELQAELNRRKSILPIIFITGHGDLPMAVEAMRQGALDFIRKPVDEDKLLNRIQQALEIESGMRRKVDDQAQIQQKAESLTSRERQVFDLVTSGETNKVVAIELGISERTVEVHRASVMNKMGARTMAQLVRMRIQLE